MKSQFSKRMSQFILFAILFPFIQITSFSADSSNPSVQNNTISDSIASERETAVSSESDKIRKNIAAFVSAGKFQDAEKEYSKLTELYETLGDTRYAQIKRSLLLSDKNVFYKKWADYLEDQAANAYLNKEYDKSIKLSEESISAIKKINPKQITQNGRTPFSLFEPTRIRKPDTSTQNNLIQDSKYEQLNNQFENETDMDKALPVYKHRIMDLDIYITEAQVYMKNRDYEKAKESLEKALILDPYNYKAMTMLKTLYSNLLRAGKARSLNEAYEAIAETQWLNNEAILPNVATENEDLKVIEAESDLMGKMKEKLETLIIPKIDFEEASVSSVITYLSRESKIADPDGKGINIILRLSNTQQEPKPVTLQLDDLPIGEIIRYVCLYSGLKYRIEDDAVIVGDDSIYKMDTKFFNIKSGLINSIVSNLDINDKAVSTDDKNFYDTSSMLTKSVVGEQKVISAELQSYFLQRGLPFPPESSIAWDSKTGMLIITNTPDNLRIAESLIKEIDVNIPLVLIEAKFIEINQNELEEIAFKWSLQYTPGKTDISSNPTTLDNPNANQSIIQHYENPGGTSQAYTEYGALINDLNISYNDFNLRFWMYALEQSETKELLSSPKVITKSGSQALIRMVTQKYYPNSWTEPEVTAEAADAGSTVDVTFSGPEFTDPTDLGIILYATPTVSPNNHTILLDLKPQVIDFVGWDDYAYNITKQSGTDTTLYNAPVKMPQISHRDLVTKVKVYDGETIVLGGTISEHAVYVDDSMPFLSEIPIAGRLFRSKYQQIEKVNLLVFVSARLINPDGTPYREQTNKFFDFER
ncbi:MAG: hypothetical protein A2X47_07955 [Lentisphaerae bacterium GWF2_38_69]|nr:MAG: hypothetical protein A2X47_07955 [Lentisphaerae bacterium GWF2_38_69]